MTDKTQKILEDLFGLLEIPSVSDNKEEVENALDYVLDLAKNMGLKSTKLLDGQVGVVEAGDGDETLGILVHVDVVSPGNLKKWKSDPFKPEIRDGNIYARGTQDDKGPIIAVLHAIKDVLNMEKPISKKIQLIIGTQEEVEWTDMEAYTASYKPADFGFTPDGSFPVANIEKGCLDVEILFEIDDNDTCEASGNRIIKINAGSAANVVPGECSVELSDGTVITGEGEAVHSCQPEKGKNAIFEAANAAMKLDLTENIQLRVLRFLKEKFENIYGEAIGLKTEEQYYKGEYIDGNVFSPTIVRTDNDSIFVNINVRTAYTSEPEEILDRLAEEAAAVGGRIVRHTYLPSVFVSRDEPFISKLTEAYEEVMGKGGKQFELAYGGSYAKAMPNTVSWGPLFPHTEDTCHEENEYISIGDLMLNYAIYKKAIAKIVIE